jgi:hypothetical protein
MPKDAWIKKWSKFKKVEFAMSFDSCDPLESEYIRWPSKYATTDAVAKRFLELKKDPKFEVFLRSTISVLNVWNMPETLMWWHTNDPTDSNFMNPTHLTYPSELCVTVLPSDLKKAVTDKFTEFQKTCDIPSINQNLEYIKNFMNSKDDSDQLPTLRNYLNKTDEYRNQNFVDYYPQFKTIFSA